MRAHTHARTHTRRTHLPDIRQGDRVPNGEFYTLIYRNVMKYGGDNWNKRGVDALTPVLWAEWNLFSFLFSCFAFI